LKLTDLGLAILLAYSPDKTVKSIAREVGIGPETVRYWLEKLGLQTRSQRVLGGSRSVEAGLKGGAVRSDQMWQDMRRKIMGKGWE